MTMAIRWRIIVLQVVALLVFGFAAGGALYAHNFIGDQVNQQLAPQQISFPATAKQGLPADLSAYAGQQVLNGDQAHAYAEKFIGLHLQEIGQGHPYSYWSGKAMADTDPALKAKDQGIADTLFKGDTLRTMLNTAWTFWVIGQIAFYAFLGLLAAAVVVLGALVFEVVEMVRGKETMNTIVVTPSGSGLTKTAPITSEPAAVN
jgi:predicted outer membrane lipoprotein